MIDSTLPADATVQAEEHSAIYDRFTVNSPIEFKGRLLTFLFPGWRVLIDGVEVPVTPLDQSGFMEFQIPAGSHRVEAELSVTQPQLIGALVSFGALVALFILGVSRRKPMIAREVAAQRPAFSVALLIVSAAFLVVKIAGSIAAIRASVTPHRRGRRLARSISSGRTSAGTSNCWDTIFRRSRSKPVSHCH